MVTVATVSDVFVKVVSGSTKSSGQNKGSTSTNIPNSEGVTLVSENLTKDQKCTDTGCCILFCSLRKLVLDLSNWRNVILYSESVSCAECGFGCTCGCATTSLLCKGACHRLLLNLLLMSPDGMMKSVLGKSTSHGTNFWKMHLSQCSLENLFHMEFLNISLFCNPLHRQYLAIYDSSLVLAAMHGC